MFVYSIPAGVILSVVQLTHITGFCRPQTEWDMVTCKSTRQAGRPLVYRYTSASPRALAMLIAAGSTVQEQILLRPYTL